MCVRFPATACSQVKSPELEQEESYLDAHRFLGMPDLTRSFARWFVGNGMKAVFLLGVEHLSLQSFEPERTASSSRKSVLFQPYKTSEGGEYNIGIF